MVPVVKDDILVVLKDAESYLRTRDTARLRELSDHTIHNSSIFQDEDSITVAVIIYSLSKICERAELSIVKFATLLRHARKHLLSDEIHLYKLIIKKLAKLIADTDGKFKLYIQAVIDKAQIKKGSRLYYHGISLAQAANLLGVSQWDLMSYVGKTQIIDSYEQVRDVKNRLDFTRKLFS